MEYKEFLVCPHCGRAIVKKEDAKEYAKEARFCGGCGKNIASTFAEVLAEEAIS